MTWAEKYRPHRFSEVVGQERAVAQLAARVFPDKRRGHVILEGPSGSGKTTLARIFAQAMQCEAPLSSGDACRGCHPCRLFEADSQPCFHSINSGLEGTVAGIRELVDEDLRARPLQAEFHVVFFDEADNLTEKAQRSLLTPLEDGSAFVLYIFSLIDADALLLPLRARSARLELSGPGPHEALTFLQRIALAERLPVAHDALWLMAQLVPSFRELAVALETVAVAADGREIVPALVRATLRKGRTDEIVAYLRAALDGDVDEQLTAISGAHLPVQDKASAVLELLTYLKLKYVGPSRAARHHRLDLLLDEDECRQIIAGFAWRADRLGVDLTTLFDEVLEFWAFQPLRVTEAALEAQVARFSDLLLMDRQFPTDRSEIAARLARARTDVSFRSSRAQRRPPAWRTGDTVPSLDRAEYLSEKQAREFYEAATFLVQRYEVTLNACLTLNHGAIGVTEDKAAVDLISDLSRELGLRMKNWGQAAGHPDQSLLHRISLLERDSDGALTSTVLLHLPGFAAERARTWIFERFLPRYAPADPSWADDWLEVRHASDAHGVLAHQWELMRRLWRGIDPTIAADGELLIDRLGVPKRGRRPAGRVSRRRYALSLSINRAARAEEAKLFEPHLSAYADRAWDWLFRRWEWREARNRRQTRRREDELLRAVSLEQEVTGDPMSARKLALELDAAARSRREGSEFPQKPWARSGSGKADEMTLGNEKYES